MQEEAEGTFFFFFSVFFFSQPSKRLIGFSNKQSKPLVRLHLIDITIFAFCLTLPFFSFLSAGRKATPAAAAAAASEKDMRSVYVDSLVLLCERA